MCVRVNACTYVHVGVCVGVCMRACMCVRVCAHVCVHMEAAGENASTQIEMGTTNFCPDASESPEIGVFD